MRWALLLWSSLVYVESLEDPATARAADIRTIAGNGRQTYSGDDGPAIEAGIAEPFGLTLGPDGSLYVGSPDTVAKKMASTIRALGLSRFHLKYSNGTLPHESQMKSLELYGTQVAPRVQELLNAAGYRTGELVQHE